MGGMCQGDMTLHSSHTRQQVTTPWPHSWCAFVYSHAYYGLWCSSHSRARVIHIRGAIALLTFVARFCLLACILRCLVYLIDSRPRYSHSWRDCLTHTRGALLFTRPETLRTGSEAFLLFRKGSETIQTGPKTVPKG